MSKIRLATGLVATLLFGGGYFASQFAYFFGDPTTYSSNIASSSVKFLSLGLLLASIVLCIIPAKEEPQ